MSHSVRIAESRHFKNALLELAEQMHERGIYQHPGLPSEALRGLPWRKLWPRVRALANTEQGRKVIAIYPILFFLAVAFSIYRYMGLGLGDREMYIVGGMGVVIFLALGVLLRKGNKV